MINLLLAELSAAQVSFRKGKAGPAQVGPSPGMSEAFPKPHQLVPLPDTPATRLCRGTLCLACLTKNTGAKASGPVPYLVPDGCISLCCSRCPACRARHPAAVWRKQAAASQHHTLRFWSLCPSCLTRQHFPWGKRCSAAARALSIHCFPTKDVQIKQEK